MALHFTQACTLLAQHMITKRKNTSTSLPLHTATHLRIKQAASVALWIALYFTSEGSHTKALKVSTTPPVFTSTPTFCVYTQERMGSTIRQAWQQQDSSNNCLSNQSSSCPIKNLMFFKQIACTSVLNGVLHVSLCRITSSTETIYMSFPTTDITATHLGLAFVF